MARRRGFFAELQYQAAKAEKERQRRSAATARAAEAAARDYERAQVAARRAAAAAARSGAQDRAAAEKEAKLLHQEAMEAQATHLNERLDARVAEIRATLKSTLDVDDYVDLDALKQTAKHPPFEPKHANPLPQPPPIVAPPRPVYQEVPAPSGVRSAFGGKKKHAADVEAARASFAQEHAAWQRQVAAIPARQLETMQRYTLAEQQRLERFAAERAEYEQACKSRETEVNSRNAELESIKAGLAEHDPRAIEEYFAIVLGNSVYPDDLPVDSELEYKAEDNELHVKLLLPGPDAIPSVKNYRYVKARDELVESKRSTKELRDLYSSFLYEATLVTSLQVV